MSVIAPAMATTEQRLQDVLAVARAQAARVDAEAAFPTETIEALRTSGLLGLTLPEAVGGLGTGPREFVEVTSSLAEACGSSAMIFLMHVSATACIAAAPPATDPDILGRLARGEWLGTLAFSERGSRSHFWAPVSREVREGNQFRVRAQKSWVTSAGHADVYVVSTLASTGQGPTDSNLYVVRSGEPEMTVAAPWRGMGMRGNASSPMTVDLLTDERWRIGPDGSGFKWMMEAVLPWFNLGNAAVSLGLARAAVEAAVHHASGTRFEHTGDALANLPTIRARLAKMRIQLDVQEAYLREAADRVATPDDSTMLHVLAVKASANDAALEITDGAMRVCGGAAFSQHLAIDRFFRDARAGHVMAPTADVLYDFYGKAITGQPLF
jgi:alkylation response protein AidB-like acyl-CoA dehydrogenase